MIGTVFRTEDVETCRALRRQVFVVDEGVPEEVEMDALDASALHFLATVDGAPVGTARLVITGTEGRIGHVCVLPAHRGSGVGAALTRAAMDAAQGLSRLTLGARGPAIGLYERLGFVADGPMQNTAWGDNLPMVLDLT